MADPKAGQVVWRWSTTARRPVQVSFVGRRVSWTCWSYGGHEWNERGEGEWFDNAVNCAWNHFEWRVRTAGYRIEAKVAKPEREAERAYEAACVYVRCFCDQFKASPQKAWESPGGVAPERADAEKHTK